MRTIDPNWVEIQPGLYLEQHSFIVNAKTYYNSRLHASEGYCFYDSEEEVYDEEGNLIDPKDIQINQRNCMTWCVTPITDVNQLNAKYISIKI